MLFSNHEAEHASELWINQKVKKRKMKANVWCESQMLLPWCACSAQEHQTQTAPKPLCRHTLKAHINQNSRTAVSLILSMGLILFHIHRCFFKKKILILQMKTSAFEEKRAKRLHLILKDFQNICGVELNTASSNTNQCMFSILRSLSFLIFPT